MDRFQIQNKRSGKISPTIITPFFVKSVCVREREAAEAPDHYISPPRGILIL
jgi:hypothetical protein